MKLANKYRPKKFADVVGQSAAVDVLTTIVKRGWKPPALLFEGPYGTGKTSLARLQSRAILCKKREETEPCGVCESCAAMDIDNHIAYVEVDAASKGLVADVRQMKDQIAYRTAGGDTKILCYDESHMLSKDAQNSLLEILEEGAEGVIFMFCTTDVQKMLPTVKSRCVELNLRLLTAGEITARLTRICMLEGINYEERALKIIGTYARGHVRDAIGLLEQLHQTEGEVTEEITRVYLRLDKLVEIYEFLTLQDKKETIERCESLLCTHSVQELTEMVSQALVDAYKVKAGLNGFSQVDQAWLTKIASKFGDSLLDKAERIFRADTDVATISYGVALIMGTLYETEPPRQQKQSPEEQAQGQTQFRKPGT